MKNIRTFKNWHDPSRDSIARQFSTALHADGGGSSEPKDTQGGGFGCFGFLLVFLALCVGIFLIFLNLFVQAPKAETEGRKSGNSTILIVGTDQSGTNTDTLMLMNFNSTEKRISLMSIPRDTRVDSTYRPHKINGAYAANGMGEKGMYWLCDYVRQCVGFTPDAYVLVDVDCFVQVVDILGGVNFDVPVKMDYDDPSQDLYIHLDPGLQHLDGTEAMGLVRFRKGYLEQDLKRVSIQREFLVTAVKQWMAKKDYYHMYQAYKVLRDNSLTDLSLSNLAWMFRCVSEWGLENMETLTIPHINGNSYIYIKEDEELLRIVNDYFNPYLEDVGFDDLNIVKFEG